MTELFENVLVFRFPELHPGARLLVDFTRTLRVPGDGRKHPRPPGLGRFSLHPVDDHAASVSPAWREHGGVMLPVRPSEALCLRFYSQPLDGSGAPYPFAVKVATGKVNAVTGGDWDENMREGLQDYLVVPPQVDIYGYCTSRGEIRQFVASPLGLGETLEERLAGRSLVGGVQIAVYPMKASVFERIFPGDAPAARGGRVREPAPSYVTEMGVSPGSPLRQHLFRDPHGPEAWDAESRSRIFIHMAKASEWLAATGEEPHGAAPTAREYEKAGLPWLDEYAGERTLSGSEALASASGE